MNEPNSECPAPKVFDYIDLKLYLADYFAYRKHLDRGFSYEAWAQELGFKSRSYLRMIAIGRKKATESFVEAFSAHVFEDPIGREYFHFLVLYSQSKKHKEKQLYGKKLVQIIHRVNGQKEIESHYDFLSDPWLSRLLILLGFNDIERSAKSLSALLNRDMNYTKSALEKLKSLGLAQLEVVHGEEIYLATNVKFKVPNKFGDLGLKAFHENSLTNALEAIGLPSHLRRYRSLLIPLDKDELERFFEMMDAFANEVLMRFQSDSYENRRLFQFNANVFPVTVPANQESSVPVPDLSLR